MRRYASSLTTLVEQEKQRSTVPSRWNAQWNAPPIRKKTRCSIVTCARGGIALSTAWFDIYGYMMEQWYTGRPIPETASEAGCRAVARSITVPSLWNKPQSSDVEYSSTTT